MKHQNREKVYQLGRYTPFFDCITQSDTERYTSRKPLPDGLQLYHLDRYTSIRYLYHCITHYRSDTGDTQAVIHE